jgi:HD-like signal output (HDOD) protein
MNTGKGAFQCKNFDFCKDKACAQNVKAFAECGARYSNPNNDLKHPSETPMTKRMPHSTGSPLPTGNAETPEQRRSLRVLFVDDQTTLLNAVRRVVQKQASSWHVFSAMSGEEAVQLLKQNPVDVVVTDMRMPGMDGVTLLTHVKEQYPNVIRFILSGYSNNDRTLEAIKVAHQFFLKPFSTREMIDALELTHSLYKRIRNPGLQSLIASVDRLPTPRRVFYQISHRLNDDYASMEEIGEIIASDPGIAGKVLQVANSAFFGQKQPVDNIHQAVTVLGVDTLRSLVLVAGIASDHKEVLNGLISVNLYSRHSLEVALISKWIAEHMGMGRDQQEALFTIGMLHDVGKLVMIKKYTEVYQANGWIEDPYQTQLHLRQIENLYCDHACIGAALIALWGLPVKVVNTLAYYIDPMESPLEDRTFECILHLADGISNYLHEGKNQGILQSGHILPSVPKWMGPVSQSLDEWIETIRTGPLLKGSAMMNL